MKIFGYEFKKIVPRKRTERENHNEDAQSVAHFVRWQVNKMLREKIDSVDLNVSVSTGSRFVLKITHKPGLF